jgi:uncharacterized protein YjbI with pentapeptide repeats
MVSPPFPVQLVIKRRGTGLPLHFGEAESVRNLVVEAVAAGVSLSEADLRGKSLAGISIPGADLVGADFSGADLAGSDVSRSRLTGVMFSEAVLVGADLSHSELSEANFAYADLEKAKLTQANLAWTNFSGANLTRADLSFSNVHHADFTGANLEGTRFAGVDLSTATMNRLAEETEERRIRKERFLTSPLGLSVLQLLWLGLLPVGSLVFGSHFLWMTFMGFALLVLASFTWAFAVTRSGWLMFLASAQTLLFLAYMLLIWPLS